MDVFEAIADPTRRAMLDLLADGERPAGDLVLAFPSMTQPGISRHLRVLREVGLVDVRPQAQQRIYALKPERLSELDAWLNKYRAFWPAQLDALERHLDRLHSPSKPTPKRSPRR
ncbi:MAG: metalloregulator ArsR/SmtB family transcription factor [Myxococcota bacterium]